MRRCGLFAAVLATGMLGVFAPAVAAADTSPPSEPGVISVSGLSSSGGVLKWGVSSDDVGIEGYRVYRGASGSSLALIATTDAVSSYSAKNLAAVFRTRLE